MSEEHCFVLKGEPQVNGFYSLLEDNPNVDSVSCNRRSVSLEEIPLLKDNCKPSKGSLGWSEAYFIYEVKEEGVVLGTIDFKAYYETKFFREVQLRGSKDHYTHDSYIAHVKINRTSKNDQKADALDSIIADISSQISPDDKDKS
jgi:hypothetical protein